jgi:hypothetical protein
MKFALQIAFGKPSFLDHTPLQVNNPFSSYHIPVSLNPSVTYALFPVTVLPQPAWNQQLPDSFYRYGGGPPSFSHLSKKGKTMNSQQPSSHSPLPLAKADPKCRHFTVSGRQCRLRAIRNGLCFRHAALQLQSAQPVDLDLSADFLGQLDDLQSAEQIKQFLAKLLILVVQNRISARRAAVLTYITNQLLHSLVAIKRELDSEPVELDWTGWPERNNPESGRDHPEPGPLPQGSKPGVSPAGL